MGKTKTQKATEERAAKKASAQEVQPQPAAEAKQPKPEVKPAVTPAPAAVAPAQPSKQQATLDKLEAAWIEKKVDLSKMSVTMDGKFMLVIPAEGWPVIQLGPTGGIVLPQIRSQPSRLPISTAPFLLRQSRSFSSRVHFAEPLSKLNLIGGKILHDE